MSDPRRALPSVDALLGEPRVQSLEARVPRALLVDAARHVIGRVRAGMERAAADGAETLSPSLAELSEQVVARAEQALRPSLRPVINATGVVLHTNLGRAALPEPAIDAIAAVSRGYCNLEYDLDAGRRGSRYDHCTGLLRELTGADAALVVNNNAAALVLALNTLALGRDVLVSRGELVEIGGSFRIADIVTRSGARLVEVGATNRTRRGDYERALGTRTGALLKVHRSNFSVRGFVEEASAAELADVAHAHGVPLIHDLGSGLMLEPAPHPLAGQTSAQRALADAADAVTMSGDKLLGGPQCGIILGGGGLVDAMRANPLCRALRVDRTTLAGLEATLRLHRDPEQALEAIPALRMLRLTESVLRERADRLAARLRGRGVQCDTLAGDSAVGGGAAPDVRLPTWLVLLHASTPAADLLAALRRGEPPVVARVVDDRVALDPRTIAEHEDDAVAAAVAAATSAA